jgi:hypothetical protein
VSNGTGSWKPVLIYIVPVILFSFVYSIPRFMEFDVEYQNVTAGPNGKSIFLLLSDVLVEDEAAAIVKMCFCLNITYYILS